MSVPCNFCGVRPDIACRHRPADPDWTPPVQKGGTRKVASGGGNYRMPDIANYKPPGGEMNGHNFRTRKRPNA